MIIRDITRLIVRLLSFYPIHFRVTEGSLFMELRQLKCFLACARHHSLTLAAEELYTTQPHISMIIKSLEQELGTKLFYRKARGVELTEAGRQIYSYAVNTVKNSEIITSITSQKMIPELRLVSNSSSHMAVLLTHYYLQQPNELHINYQECGIEEMIDRVADGKAELGFLFVPNNRSFVLRHMLLRRSLEFFPLLTTDLVVYVRKEHPLFGQKTISPEQLLQLSFIQLEDDFFSVEAMLEAFPVFRANKNHLHKVVSTNSGHMMIQMLENTDLCNVGSYWLGKTYRQHDFGRIRIDGMEQTISFGYLSYKGKPLTPETDSFLSFLKGALDEEYAMT